MRFLWFLFKSLTPLAAGAVVLTQFAPDLTVGQPAASSAPLTTAATSSSSPEGLPHITEIAGRLFNGPPPPTLANDLAVSKDAVGECMKSVIARHGPVRDEFNRFLSGAKFDDLFQGGDLFRLGEDDAGCTEALKRMSAEFNFTPPARR